MAGRRLETGDRKLKTKNLPPASGPRAAASRMARVRLLKAHIHKREMKKAGDEIEVGEGAARWLVDIGAAERI